MSPSRASRSHDSHISLPTGSSSPGPTDLTILAPAPTPAILPGLPLATPPLAASSLPPPHMSCLAMPPLGRPGGSRGGGTGGRGGRHPVGRLFREGALWMVALGPVDSGM